MLLYGASGHAKVIITCLSSCKEKVESIFDDNPAIQSLLGINVSGKYNAAFLPEKKIIISIGDNIIRKQVSKLIKHEYGKAIHSSAVIDESVIIGEGTVVMHNTVIQVSSTIGKHAIVNTSASVDHDCVLGDFVHISPNVTLCGNVIIGEGTHIGVGASVIPNITIGKWATIGAGSVIINDVPDYAVVVGNPGRIIKYKSENAIL